MTALIRCVAWAREVPQLSRIACLSCACFFWFVCVFLWFHDLLAKILFKTGCLHVLDGSQSLAIPEIVAIVFSPARHTPYLFVIAPQETFINIHNV